MFASSIMLWAQAGGAGLPPWLVPIIRWLYVLGEPTISIAGVLGSLITWVKVVALFGLLGWVASRVAQGLKERVVTGGRWLDVAALIALFGMLGTALLRVLQTSKRVSELSVGPIPLATLLAFVFGGVILIWVERALWATIGRLGRASDKVTLGFIHLALALGVAEGYALLTLSGQAGWRDALVLGTRLGATYMGFVVLGHIIYLLAGELVALRFRRIRAIAGQAVVESNRRMWAPYVVVTVFLVILAFTHWFLQPPRPAEMGRLFVGTLTLLCSLLLTVMIVILAPISLPNDIRQMTIYTIVSKPVRRLELIWGRVAGYMVLVTILTAVFGGISLGYLWRTVGGTIKATEAAARKALAENRPGEAKVLREQAEQLRTRMAARVPVNGMLTFIDSRGTNQARGIDVGQEQSQNRSHIEGATPSTATWTYGRFVDPYDPHIIIDRRVPVADLLRAGTIEELDDRIARSKATIAQAQAPAGTPAKEAAKDAEKRVNAAGQAKIEGERLVREVDVLRKQAADLEAKAVAAEAAKDDQQARRLRAEANRLHSPPIPIEMTFTVYRTTKGRIGEPVFAELEVTNPRTGAEFRDIIPIREYYTNKVALPASYLAGSEGDLTVEVRCISPTQYLGMAESDLYLLAASGNFGSNFMVGLFGVWLQALVLTTIGVFAGTFLSWPVALLITIAFFVAGQVAFSFLQEFALQSLSGGGPFESLIRLLSHENLVNELTPTLAVVTAKTLDSLVLPVMSRLVFVVPNFAALDVSNTVANGYAVGWSRVLGNTLLALAYAIPFSIAGYFILKNREVAA